MLKTTFRPYMVAAILSLATPASASFFKVPDTDFGVDVSEAETIDTSSLLMKFNYKTNDLNLGSYTGTWKNKKSSSKFLIFGKRKSSTEITLIHELHGTWTMFCSGVLKEFDAFGISFDRDNDVDYQCVMQSGDQQAVMTVLPFKKPKFSLGPPTEHRTVNITLPDGAQLQATSLHQGVGNKREYQKPIGYKILRNAAFIGGLGRVEKENVILVNASAMSASEAHMVFMSNLGLWFFGNNDRKSPLD